MNDLESAARPILTELIAGRFCTVDAEVAKALAVWTAKTCLMAEFTHPESNATPPEHYWTPEASSASASRRTAGWRS